MQQAGVILSITPRRGVQGEKNAEYRFLNFLSRAELYAGKLGILFEVGNLCDFGHVWRAIARL